MDKRYQFKDHEARIYTKEKPHFIPTGKGEPYCIMMPPPNVTGALHVGHALDYTLQDILIRYHRMRGRDVLWQPGTDHAGIATQMVVERQLKEKGTSRQEIGREAFLQACFKWKDESQARIIEQQQRLGISPDWERSRFTLDEGLNKAVLKIFKKLFDDGLIYKAKRLVNWNFGLNTALSDLEVVSKEMKDKLYYISYQLVGCHPHENEDPHLGEDDSAKQNANAIIIATTRPETLFGDTAIAVHPDDERYQHLIGKMAIVPLCNREIPIIADDYADPEKGSGAVKITPAHDFNDYEVGKRHDLPSIDLFENGGMLQDRAKVVADLGDALVQVDDITHAVPVYEKNGDRVEPRLTDQWYVDAAKLAVPALAAVHNGQLNFIPQQWVNTYQRWLEDIQPWCISRQLWWGHRIPVWYGPDGHVFCAETEADAYVQAKKLYGNCHPLLSGKEMDPHFRGDDTGCNITLTQDSDVLDTWFSSALWPFSTLGWPEETPELARYFPTSVLVTGFDIIFFWVARMTMMSYYIFEKSPFKDVYIHALVRDEKGQKMSKSRGNVINPLDLMDQYGTDSMRLALCALSVPGRDIALGNKVVEGYSHFITKLWNAGRFLDARLSNCQPHASEDPLNSGKEMGPRLRRDDSLSVHQWMQNNINTAIEDINTHLENYRFDLYVKTLYKLIWDQFCDVYLEALKTFDDEQSLATARQIFLAILHLCHPIMPFVTEVLSEHFGGALLLSAKWPEVQHADGAIFNQALEICQQIKFFKNTMEIKEKIQVAYTGNNPNIQTHAGFVEQFCWVELSRGDAATAIVFGALTFFGITMDVAKLGEKKQKLEQDLSQCEKLLANDRFKTEKPELYAEKLDLQQSLTQQISVLLMTTGSTLR